MKKLTYEYVKERFEKEGYILLSKEYVNSRNDLYYCCPKGHRGKTTWKRWLRGSRCRKCFFIGITVPAYKIKQAIEEEHYNLLEEMPEEYTSKTEFFVICNKGHTYKTSWNKWQNGYRCKKCGYEKLSELYKHDYADIKFAIEKEGYRLLSKEYKNAKTKLEYICPYGHKHSITWNDWKTGYRCPTCATIKMSGAGSPNWRGGISFEPYCPVWKDKEYKESIKERDGYKCLNPYCDTKNPEDLVIHHIDYDKKNCSPSNLITVCRVCNIKANKDRSWHEFWYKAVLNKKYNY